MRQRRKDNLQGTLDLLVLRTLREGHGLHGFAIAQRIHEVSRDALRVEEGSLYPALHRMEESGWLSSGWEASDNNRRARYYKITARGRRHLASIEEEWTAHVRAVARVLRLA
jgi:PadR family transcriptional regulator, regulatory protein PadR